jgi:four helix bundle protein
MTMLVRSYRDLEAWQKAMLLVEECYRASGAFPASEIYGLTSQLRRAAVSIPANIAEGRARLHTGEFIQHLSIAYASLAELETHIQIAARIEYLSTEDESRLLTRCGEVGRLINGLRRSLRATPS